MTVSEKLNKDESGKSVCQKTYMEMIGSLLYLTASRPGIMFVTFLCARYQADPKDSHYKVVKRIFRYLKGTPNLGLWYPKGSGFDLIRYTDTDYAGCKLDRKSTSGGCQLLGGKLVSWSSKKQNSIATSTVEAEFVAAGGCFAQLLWMPHQLADYDVILTKTAIMCDNESAIAITENPGKVVPKFVGTNDHLADIFTKSLSEERHFYILERLGTLNPSQEMLSGESEK
ncbi:secreted RxLR effector protein 161-like [Rutidosis leptorrhynchoides]|uniref:secreted RxLR effector protein 161-like n=1 Tax=Rutidosis leptorrhynchoides TaxID=125765 RepID=UPI003A9936E2